MTNTKFTLEKKILTILSLWLSFIFVIISIVASESNDKFYNIGPNENLNILGIKINTYYKYFMVILCSVINSLLRSTNNILLGNWLTNNVCDIKYKFNPEHKILSYWITTISHIYTWVDWLIYYSLLLVQIDMFVIELFCDIIIANILTSYYLSHIIPNFHKEINSNPNINRTESIKIDGYIRLND